MSTDPLSQALRRQRAHDRLVLRLDDELGTLHGLGWADFVLLELLDGQGAPMSLRDLAGALAWPPAVVARQLAPLAKTGLVAREPAGVVLRPAARGRLQEARETARAACDRLAQAAP